MDVAPGRRDCRVREYGLARLEAALGAHGIVTARGGTTLRCADGWTIATGTPGAGDALPLLSAAGVSPPIEPEALCIRRLTDAGDGRRLVVYGADERGLLYALVDVARQVELSGRATEPLLDVSEALERPALAVRGVFKFYYQTDNDDAWFHSREFWDCYLGMLVAARYNAFTLVYGGDTPLVQYPFIVQVPGYEHVRVAGLPNEERARTLESLRFISSLAASRGVAFGLALWGHGLETDFRSPWGYTGSVARPPHYKHHEIIGLTEADLRPYCAAAIGTVLRECPEIARIQLRLNDEAGLPTDELDDLWSTVFAGVVAGGRPVQLDLRAKGSTDPVIRAALAVDPAAFISTKYTTEHMGLPYHPAQVQRRERPTPPAPPGEPPCRAPDGPRYGYGALLRHPLRYGFVWQLWSFGTQRPLTWGDPGYAACFARSATLIGGGGIEVGSLLGYQGHWHAAGTYRLLVDPRLDFARWEEERYWYFYLLFGRLGYDAHASPEIWRRELRARFGAAAGAVETAYAAASKVLPLLTTFRTPAAANRQYWPVMDPGGSMEDYTAAEPGDPGVFCSIDEYVSDHLRGALTGKIAPWRVREWLLTTAEEALRATAEAERRFPGQRSGELLAASIDVTIQAALGRYHAARIAAGLDYAYASQTGAAEALTRARAYFAEAVRAWDTLVRVTDGAYNPNLRGFGGQSKHHLAQWSGGTAVVRAVAEELDRLHGDPAFGAATGSDARLPSWSNLAAGIPGLQVSHEPVATAAPGAKLDMRLRIAATLDIERVRLHYRYVNQREPYVVVDMVSSADDAGDAGRIGPAAGARRDAVWSVTIPAAYVLPEWRLMYFFTISDRTGRVARYPGLDWPDCDAPYYVVAVGLQP